jgi:uncharacterized cupin superfamily protein
VTVVKQEKPCAVGAENVERRRGVSPPLHAVDLPLFAERPPESDVVSGTPSTGGRVVRMLAGTEVGVWEMTAGAVRDVEEDEVFVVLSGSATIEFEGGEEVIVGPGDVMSLVKGQRTVWTVTERLRKVYVVTAGGGPEH